MKLWWHRLPACTRQRQDAGAIKNLSKQQCRVRTAHRRCWVGRWCAVRTLRKNFLKQEDLINHHHADHHQRRSGG